MKYKAIFSDFDGTLYRSDYTISDKNKDAIHRYIKAGGKFVLATGRLFQAIYPKAMELGLDGDIVVYQGAGIYDLTSKKMIYSHLFDRELAVEVARYLDGLSGIVPMAYIDDQCCTQFSNPYTDNFAKICQISYTVTGKKLEQLVSESDSLPIKLLALVDPKDARIIEKNARDKFQGRVALCRSNPFILEFLPVGIDKGNAIEFLWKRYGLTREEVIAVGDSENDLSMIKRAGLGIATANAFDEVKEQADWVSVSNDDDAIAQIVDEICLK